VGSAGGVRYSREAGVYGFSEKSLRARVERKTLPFKKFGHRILFNRDELDNFFEQLDGCAITEALENLIQRDG